MPTALCWQFGAAAPARSMRPQASGLLPVPGNAHRTAHQEPSQSFRCREFHARAAACENEAMTVADKTDRQRFLSVVSRLIESSDPVEGERLKEELARMTFGGRRKRGAPPYEKTMK